MQFQNKMIAIHNSKEIKLPVGQVQSILVAILEVDLQSRTEISCKIAEV